MGILPYSDDFLLWACSKKLAYRARALVEWTLYFLGIPRKEGKGHWEPTQFVEDHLGLAIDLK